MGTTLTVLTMAEGARFGVGDASDGAALCSNGLLSTALTVSVSTGAGVTFNRVGFGQHNSIRSKQFDAHVEGAGLRVG